MILGGGRGLVPVAVEDPMKRGQSGCKGARRSQQGHVQVAREGSRQDSIAHISLRRDLLCERRVLSVGTEWRQSESLP